MYYYLFKMVFYTSTLHPTYCNNPKLSDKQSCRANNKDPDQTAPSAWANSVDPHHAAPEGVYNVYHSVCISVR